LAWSGWRSSLSASLRCWHSAPVGTFRSRSATAFCGSRRSASGCWRSCRAAVERVLSIGKVGMSAGQQMYYEQQVAAGREDYYAGKGEAPGRWTGRGAVLLELSGELNAE